MKMTETNPLPMRVNREGKGSYILTMDSKIVEEPIKETFDENGFLNIKCKSVNNQGDEIWYAHCSQDIKEGVHTYTLKVDRGKRSSITVKYKEK